jgi:hypothetical protein
MERNEPAAAAADNGGDALAGIVVEEGADTGAAAAQPQEADPAAQAEEAFARRLGWRPKEEFPGPTDKWVDAKSFVDKTMSKESLLRSQLRRQDEKIQTLEKHLERVLGATDEILDRSRGAEQRGFEYARDTLRAKMREAVANADTAAYERHEQELQQLEQMRPKGGTKKPDEADGKPGASRQPQQEMDPVTKQWMRENPWVESKKFFNIALGIEQDLLETRPDLSMRERLDEVTAEVKRRFPEKFGNPARSAPPATARPGPQAARTPVKKTRTVADLDDNAKAALAKLKRMNPALTDEDYLKSYKWDK